MTDARAATARIYEQWHTAVTTKDIEMLASLCAGDAVFESPLVWATSVDRSSGFLRGRAGTFPPAARLLARVNRVGGALTG